MICQLAAPFSRRRVPNAGLVRICLLSAPVSVFIVIVVGVVVVTVVTGVHDTNSR